MRPALPLVALALLLSLAGCLAEEPQEVQPEAPGAPLSVGEEYDLHTEDGDVHPDSFPLVVNETRLLLVRNDDDVARTFAVPALGLETRLVANEISPVEVRPSREGEIAYEIRDETGTRLASGTFVVVADTGNGRGAPVGGLVGPGPANKTSEDLRESLGPGEWVPGPYDAPPG